MRARVLSACLASLRRERVELRRASRTRARALEGKSTVPPNAERTEERKGETKRERYRGSGREGGRGGGRRGREGEEAKELGSERDDLVVGDASLAEGDFKDGG